SELRRHVVTVVDTIAEMFKANNETPLLSPSDNVESTQEEPREKCARGTYVEVDISGLEPQLRIRLRRQRETRRGAS
ncbi:hypothetical protein BDN67DRAFT_974490, partial [Paxillus ammoniavirescens]